MDVVRDVVIAGGGHAGLFLGAGLARCGFAVTVVDGEPAEAIRAAGPNGRSLALLAGSRAVAQRLGIWAGIADLGERVDAVHVVDAASGSRVVYGEGEAGPFGHGYEAACLRRGLLDTFLELAGDDALVQGRLASFRREPQGVVVRLEDGRSLRARLLVGADGRRSLVRELAGIGCDHWDYGEGALCCVVEHERPHENRVREWLRPGGPLALLPLLGGRSGVTWAEPIDRAYSLASLPPAELMATLRSSCEDALGPLRLASGPTVYPLTAQHARRYVTARVALVGDAAHGVHPIHAQGFNMGVADIGALVDALTTARRRRLDIGSGEALIAYERARRLDNLQRLWLTDSLSRLSTAELPPIRALRSATLSIMDRITPLKRLAIRHGMQAG